MIEKGKQREQREQCPPVPEAACQLGKARWKQSHMMAVVVEAAAAKMRSWAGQRGRVVVVED